MDSLAHFAPEAKTYQIALVAPNLAPGKIWDQVAPFIEKALTRSHSLNLSLPTDILSHVLLGHCQMWVAYAGAQIDGVVISRVIDWDRSKSLFIPIVGGRNLRGWHDPMMAELERYARSLGCRDLKGEYRKGWARMSGFEITGVTLTRVL